MKRIHLALAMALLWLTSGCYTFYDRLEESKIAWRNQVDASKSWRDLRPLYSDLAYTRDFKLGYKAGYIDVAGGGEGCPPRIAPRRYWKACYRDAKGRQKTIAWYDGFTHGVIAAEKDGVNAYNEIFTLKPDACQIAAPEIHYGSDDAKPVDRVRDPDVVPPPVLEPDDNRNPNELPKIPVPATDRPYDS